MKIANGNAKWPERSTPEDLEMERGISMVIDYRQYVIAIAFGTLGLEYHAAIYTRGFDDHNDGAIYSCEDEVFLSEALEGTFQDNGRAIEAAINRIK